MSELSDRLLQAPVSARVKRPDPEKEFTAELEVQRDNLQLTLRDEIGKVNEGTARQYLEEEGQNPDDWEVTHFRKLKWGPPDSPYESVKFSFKRVGGLDGASIDELIERVNTYRPTTAAGLTGDHGYIIALGDMQFGKIDGDGVDGTLQRTLDCLAMAARRLDDHRMRFPIGHVHIAWLGDHVEGFTSQGGANTWRTGLTMNEQIRLVRRVMLHALEMFADRAERVSMAAVPGNHGEPQRFKGKGVTTYDDSHDTESLIAVSDAASLNPSYGHVQFYVPERDEMTLTVDVAGTAVGHAHGHQWRPGKHFDWWEGQAFGGGSPVGQADLLLAGHLHHFHVDSSSKRRFIQVPAMESESTWWRHRKGEIGDPGIVTAITKDGKTNLVEVVQ